MVTSANYVSRGNRNSPRIKHPSQDIVLDYDGPEESLEKSTSREKSVGQALQHPLPNFGHHFQDEGLLAVLILPDHSRSTDG